MRDRGWNTLLALTTLLLVGGLPAAANTHIERELALAPGGSFVLDTDTGSVEVAGGSASGARVELTSSRDDFEAMYDISFEEVADGVVVRVKKRRKVSNWFKSSGNARFRIEVPGQTRLDIDTAGGSINVDSIDAPVRLDTSGGSIRATAIRGELSADTSGGSIRIEDVDGDVTADTSGGSIEIRGVRGKVSADTSGGGIAIDDVTGDIDADTSGGSIKVTGAGGRVNAETSGGPIRVAFSPGNGSGGSLSTSGGGITVEVDPSVGLDIDAYASGGTVDLDVPVTVEGRVSRTAVSGKIGSGGETLRLRTSGGGIDIAPAR